LQIELVGEIASRPYLEMTLDLLAHFGIRHEWKSQTISIPAQTYQSNHYIIESDWSGASYWFSLVALAQSSSLKLLHLREKSLQGDRVMVEIASQLGVKSTFTHEGVVLTKSNRQASFEYDFSDCPDLAQTVAVMCAGLGLRGKLTGLKSLRIKETDRIAAIQNELQKLGAIVEVEGDEAILIHAGKLNLGNQPLIQTYDDHRMAMAFAPLALFSPIRIEHPDVVKKSYPSFWEHLKLIDFHMV
jgi:3-phosphoshikimate 1-carboxyvinyltransferase